jgi:TonB family protein
MKTSKRLPLCRSMLICFGLVQSLSASAAGLRQLPQTGAGQLSTVQVATPGAHALSQEERNALIGELAVAPEFSIKVNQANWTNEGLCPVSISETRVRSVHRNTVSSGNPSGDPETALPANDYAIEANLSLHSESPDDVAWIGLQFTNHSPDSEFLVNPGFPKPTVGDFAYEIPLMLVTGDPSQLEVEVVSVAFRNGKTFGNFSELPTVQAPPRKVQPPASQPGTTEQAQAPAQSVPTPGDSPSYVNGSQPIASRVDRMPRALNRPRPNYTIEARNNRVNGSVRARVLVDKQGNPDKIQILGWLPDGLTEQAIRAIKEMKFSPAIRSGEELDYLVILEVEFDLR